VVSRDIFKLIKSLRASSNPALNVSRDGASTTSLGNLCHCLTIFTVKNFFLISSLNLPFLRVNLGISATWTAGYPDTLQRLHYLDFIKAFNTVFHNILLGKLRKCGLDERSVRWIEN